LEERSAEYFEDQHEQDEDEHTRADVPDDDVELATAVLIIEIDQCKQ
jgi:hypothetical protein